MKQITYDALRLHEIYWLSDGSGPFIKGDPSLDVSESIASLSERDAMKVYGTRTGVVAEV